MVPPTRRLVLLWSHKSSPDSTVRQYEAVVAQSSEQVGSILATDSCERVSQRSAESLPRMHRES
jgi:hypothetical protein